MKRKRFTEEQIIGGLKEADRATNPMRDATVFVFGENVKDRAFDTASQNCAQQRLRAPSIRLA